MFRKGTHYLEANFEIVNFKIHPISINIHAGQQSNFKKVNCSALFKSSVMLCSDGHTITGFFTWTIDFESLDTYILC